MVVADRTIFRDWLRAGMPVLLLAHGLALAGDDRVLAETARRLGMLIDVVDQHARSGCDSGRPNEQLICGTHGLVVEELELERVHGALVSELQDPDARAKLVAAQDAWSAFRDKACAFEADGYSRSRDLDSVIAGCKASYTHVRTEQLKAFLGCGGRYGCPGLK
jgi:uncharacterized protein YecT (DUF1311 family)